MAPRRCAAHDPEDMWAIVRQPATCVGEVVWIAAESCCLKAVPGRLSRHTPASDPMQLFVDERDQLVQRRVIALSPFDEESRDIARGLRHRDGRACRAEARARSHV